MAGEKSGDNKIFQLMTLIITTIVAPITVYLVTNSVSKANTPPPTSIPTVVEASSVTVTREAPTLTLPALPTVPVELPATLTFTPEWTATPTATQPVPTETALPPTPTLEPSPTSYGVQNPSGLIPAGTPAVVNNLALVVESDDVVMEGKYLRLNLIVRNLGDNNQPFTFTAKSIKIKDDTGKVYTPFMGEKKPACKENDLTAVKQIQVEPGKEVTIRSTSVKDFDQWCGRDGDALLPVYLGPVSEKAKSLRIELEGFGPFSGFVVEVNLK